MGQGGQVARSAERALLEDDGQDVFVEKIQQTRSYGLPNPGIPQGDVVGFQKQHEAHQERRYRGTRPTGVRADQVVLQVNDLLRGDDDVVQGTKPCIDTVIGLIGHLEGLVEVVAAGLDTRYGLR